MPRRKQAHPQPLKAESEDGTALGEPSCSVLEGDFLLNGELEFGDSIMGLDRDAGVTLFTLSLDDDDTSAPSASSFPALLSCKACGRLLGDAPLGVGLGLGVGLDLGAELQCLSCEVKQTTSASTSSPQDGSVTSERSVRKKKSTVKGAAASKLFSCSLCAFSSRYSNHLKRHMRIHDGQKPYGCPVCTYASAQLVNLQRHLRTHTGEKPYSCPHCSYACSSLGNLRRHQRMHAQQGAPGREEEKRGRRKTTKGGEEQEPTVSQDSSYLQTLGGLGAPTGPLPALLFPLRCRACGVALEDADMEGGAGEAEAGGQVCRRCSSVGPLCSPGVPRGAGRRRGATELYRCHRCPFLSRYPNHLSRHAHTHSEEKPYHCAHCSYASSNQDNLKRHTRVHTGEKPYQCPSCSYACGNMANMRRHQRIHSGAKPFRCAVCGYSCNQSMNLKRHMLRHTGQKPYACGRCAYTTGHWDNYKRHQRKHGHHTALG